METAHCQLHNKLGPKILNNSLKALGVFVLLLAWIIIPGQGNAQSAGVAYSPDTAWVITSVNGNARVRSLDATVIPATAGNELAEGMTVTTGDASRMVLTRAGDTITVSPNSAFSVGPDTPNASSPSILQTLGTLLFSIDSSAGPRNFQVRTPYLAAVIKGTVFSVSVTPEGSALHVTEGLVQVADLATGQTGLVAVGQTARVTSSGGGGLNIDRGDGSGGTEPKKEGNHQEKEDGNKEKKVEAGTGDGNASTSNGNGNANGKTNNRADAEGNGKRDGKARGLATGRGNGNSNARGLRIESAIDVGVGNVAENTGGLVSMSAPGHNQANPGDARYNAPGQSRNNVSAGGPKVDTVAAVQSNASGNGNGNAGGNPNAGGGNPNAGGGNPNAGGGNGNGNS